jgi:LmbE family N-acetylglucosaminyl deacetylase
MLRATLGPPGGALTILALGAHSDDIEIGAAGTVLRLLDEHPGSLVHWVVFSAEGEREAEARASAADVLARAASATVEVHRFRESYFPFVGSEIKDRFEALKGRVQPDLVLTHRTADRHQDHRLVAELTWNTFRDHAIAEYEVPKYDGDLGQPNLFAPLPEAVARRKIALLLKHFASQRHRSWFKAESFESLMRIRGIECNADSGFAEAFHMRKLTL